MGPQGPCPQMFLGSTSWRGFQVARPGADAHPSTCDSECDSDGGGDISFLALRCPFGWEVRRERTPPRGGAVVPPRRARGLGRPNTEGPGSVQGEAPQLGGVTMQDALLAGANN